VNMTCVQLVNHGADAGLLARMTAAMHAFFDLPLEAKLQVGWGRSAGGGLGAVGLKRRKGRAPYRLSEAGLDAVGPECRWGLSA